MFTICNMWFIEEWKTFEVNKSIFYESDYVLVYISVYNKMSTYDYIVKQREKEDSKAFVPNDANTYRRRKKPGVSIYMYIYIQKICLVVIM